MKGKWFALALGMCGAYYVYKKRIQQEIQYPLYLKKDAPLYAQPNGEKIRKLRAYKDGERQKVIVKKYIDRKWVEVDVQGRYFMKLFHLQVNDTKYEYLVAKERTPLYTEATEKSKKIIDIPFGIRVKILSHHQGEKWTHIEFIKNKNKISGFVLAAHFKY